jgi:antitoxin FitA
MPSLTLKNVPAVIHRRLKERAARHRRSLNNEAIECLGSVVLAERVDVQAILAEARRLRRGMRGPITDDDISALKKSGRP